MIFYAIRHKATGELMPQGKKNRGYSHWNPSSPEKFTEALPIPRLLATEKKAKGCITQWLAMPNAKQSYTISYEGHEDDSLVTKPDGRKKEDLEVVQINIKVKGPNDPFWKD